MLIAKIENNEITKVADYRDMFQNISFNINGPDDNWLNQNNCMKVSVFKDFNSRTQKLIPCDPYIENNFVYTVTVVDLTEDELLSMENIEAVKVRAERNRKLSESDWTQLTDTPADIKNNWLTYRQQLRDLPTQNGFPFSVSWPDAPGINSQSNNNITIVT